jgi:LacI family transcriptional regulator, galactose operon repressor
MKRIGIPEIARLAKVSLATVDRALNGRKGIRDETRNRILRIAEEFGYKPNLAARALSIGKRTHRIGICIPRELHYFYDQVREGLQAEASEFEAFGVELVHSPSDRLAKKEFDHVKDLLSKKSPDSLSRRLSTARSAYRPG